MKIINQNLQTILGIQFLKRHHLSLLISSLGQKNTISTFKLP